MLPLGLRKKPDPKTQPQTWISKLRMLLALHYRSAATRNQVDNKNYERHQQQEVNQRATNIADEAQEPKHQKNHKDCPQHFRISFSENRKSARKLTDDWRSNAYASGPFGPIGPKPTYLLTFSTFPLKRRAPEFFAVHQNSPFP